MYEMYGGVETPAGQGWRNKTQQNKTQKNKTQCSKTKRTAAHDEDDDNEALTHLN